MASTIECERRNSRASFMAVLSRTLRLCNEGVKVLARHPRVTAAELVRTAAHVSPDDVRRVGALLGTELLRPAHVHVRGIQVVLGVRVELVHAPEATRERAERAPRVQQLAVEIELGELLCDAVSDPQMLIFSQQERI